jgi:hypothetical protein
LPKLCAKAFEVSLVGNAHILGQFLTRLLDTHISLIYQIVLSSITKKGETESASRLLIILVIMTTQFGRINAFNKMCEGLKEQINVNTQRKALIFV